MEGSSEIIKLRRKLKNLMDKKMHDDALIVGDYIIEFYKTNTVEDFDLYIDDLFNIAFINFETGNYLKAHDLYKESANISLSINGANIAFAYRLNNIGVIHSKLENYKGAVKSHEEAHKIFYSALGERAEDTINSLYNLGNAYYDFKSYDSSLKCLKKALYLRQKKNMDYADNLNSIGYAYIGLGEYEQAAQFLTRAFELIESKQGTASLECVKNAHYIGEFFYRIQDYTNALDYYTIFLEHAPEVIDIKNMEYIRILKRVSEIYKNDMEYEKALDLQLKLLELYIDFMGESHIFIANQMISIALVLKNLEDYKSAANYCLKALSIKSLLMGENNLEYVKDLILLSSLYFEDKSLMKTVETVSQIMEIIEKNQDILDNDESETGRIYLHSNKMYFNMPLETYSAHDLDSLRSLEELLSEMYNNIDTE